MSQAYASKGTGSLGLMDNGVVKVVASKIEHGCVLLPKSAKEERMKTSRDICVFKSCKEDMEQKRMEEIQVFSSLFPYNEWKEEPPNLNVGDVCLSKYEHTVGKADYQLCKMVEAEKDAKKLLRTRNEKEESLPLP